MLRRIITTALLCACAVALAAPNEDNFRKAADDAQAAAKKGPADIELADQAVLRLPGGHQFVPQPHAQALLNAMGNPGKDPRLQGLIVPDSDGGWFMTVRFEAAGFVKDDDARDWNADDMLKSYREGTEASNEERVKLGVPAIEIVGWAEKPAYDAATHRLVWAMSSRDKGTNTDAPRGVNYNTYALGREGYFMLNLVTVLDDLPKHKPAAHTMLQALDYKEGKRYADFNAKTDHVAEYGLAALVVGVAAKKLGLIALGIAFFAKFAKVILLGLALVGGGFVKLFSSRRKAAATAQAATPTVTAPMATAAAPVEPPPR
jgi:uncharacterized membrane-anchored protein